MIARTRLQQIYENAGGEQGLQKILRDFYREMASDVMIGHFFTGKTPDQIADQQKHFLMKAMGIIPIYHGKAPAQAHTKLPAIQNGHFDRRLRILEKTLRRHGLSPENIKSWVAFEESFRQVIVAKT